MHSMAEQDRDKLNKLQHLLPEGAVVEASWLEDRGYPRSLRSHYVANGWLMPIAHGVVAKPGTKLSWQAIVYSLQFLMEYDVLVGGRTALELHGFAHYLRPQGMTEIQLYHEGRLPGWLSKLPFQAHFVERKATRLFPKGHLVQQMQDVRSQDAETDQKPQAHVGVSPHIWGPPHQPILVSSPERAVLELMDELPNNESFTQVDAIFDSLTNLRPRRLQELLDVCHSVKVNRLFFWFARRHDLAWAKRLSEDSVKLGSGKRSLVKGGRLDPRYQITVPEEMHADL